MKEIIINHIVNYEFIYLFLFCSIIFLLISIFIQCKTIKKITLLLFSIFSIFFAFEFFLFFFMDNSALDSIEYGIRPLQSDNIYEKNELAVLVDKKYIVVDNINRLRNYDNYKILYDKKYSLYTNGFRYTKGNSDSSESYVFLGCSFTFGVGLTDDETLPYYFSKLYNFEKNIINCGVSGKSTNTILSILNNEIFLPLIKNKKSKIEHFFYSMIRDHIARNFRITDPSNIEICKNKKWYIPTIIGKIKYIFSRSYIFRKIFVPIIDEYFKQYYEDYMIKSLKEINKIVEKKYNSKLTIIIWPDFDVVWPDFDKSFMKKLKGTNLDLIVLPDKFNSQAEGYRIKNDGHPSAKANQELSQILYNHINNKDKIN